MTNYKAPGLNITEVAATQKSSNISEGLIPMFVGYTEKGGLSSEPILVRNMFEYEQAFGGPYQRLDVNVTQNGSDWDVVSDVTVNGRSYKYLMYYSVEFYFANGGGPCYILSVYNYDETTHYIHDYKYRDAFLRIYHFNEAVIVQCPESIYGLPVSAAINQNYSQYYTGKEAHKWAVDNGRSIVFMDISPVGYRSDPYTIYDDAKVSPRVPNLDRNLMVLYSPQAYYDRVIDFPEDRIIFHDPGNLDPTHWGDVSLAEVLDDIAGDPNSFYKDIVTSDIVKAYHDKIKETQLLLSGSVLAVLTAVKVARETGPWTVPLNVPIGGISGLNKTITEKDLAEKLWYEHTDGDLYVNPILNRDGKIVVWGNYTYLSRDLEGKFVNHQLLKLWVRYTIERMLEDWVFEANNAITWNHIKGKIASFLTDIYNRGGLKGDSPKEAFFILCGLHDTMTEEDVLEGRIIIEIGLSLRQPLEFFTIKFSHKINSEA